MEAFVCHRLSNPLTDFVTAHCSSSFELFPRLEHRIIFNVHVTSKSRSIDTVDRVDSTTSRAMSSVHSINYIFISFFLSSLLQFINMSARGQEGHSERCRQHSLNCRLRNHLGLKIMASVVIGIDKVIDETA